MKANKPGHLEKHGFPKKTCPACGSSEIDLWMGSSLGMIYKCRKCGYTGPVIIEEDP